MVIIEMSENKLDKLMESTHKMFKYGQKVMECIEEMSEASQMGQRGGGYGDRGYGNRGGGGYGNRNYGNRSNYEPEDEEENDEDYGNRGDGGYGNRRGVKGTGRYSRYR